MCLPSQLRAGTAILMLGGLLAACSTTSAQMGSPDNTTATASLQAAGNSNSLLQIADSLAAEGAYSAAIPVYKRAIAKNSSPEALLGLSHALNAVGQYVEAADVLETGHTSYPDNTKITRTLANTYISLGRPGDALALLDNVLDKNPFDADAISSRAVVLDALGRHDEAVSTYKRGLQTAPDHMGLQHNYGLSLALAGDDYGQAITLLKGSATAPNATASERQNLAMAYALSGDDRKASQILSIDSDSAEVENKLAYYHQIQALPLKERFQAILTGKVQPKQDIGEPANRTYKTDDKTRNETVARLVTEPEPPVATAEPEPEPAPAPVVDDLHDIPLLSESVGWALQIAAYRKPEQLREGWGILKEKYADIIGNLEPRRSEVDFGDRTEKPTGFFYRLNAGPLTSLEEATGACKKMHKLGADCWVRQPEPSEGTLPKKPE